MVNWDLHYPMLAYLLVLAVDLRPTTAGTLHAHWAGCRTFHLIGLGWKDDS